MSSGISISCWFFVDFSLLQYLGSWLVLMFAGQSFIWCTYHKKKINSSSDWDLAGSAGELKIESESWRLLTSMPPSHVFKWWWFLEPGIRLLESVFIDWILKKVVRKKRKTRLLVYDFCLLINGTLWNNPMESPRYFQGEPVFCY